MAFLKAFNTGDVHYIEVFSIHTNYIFYYYIEVALPRALGPRFRDP